MVYTEEYKAWIEKDEAWIEKDLSIWEIVILNLKELIKDIKKIIGLTIEPINNKSTADPIESTADPIELVNVTKLQVFLNKYANKLIDKYFAENKTSWDDYIQKILIPCLINTWYIDKKRIKKEFKKLLDCYIRRLDNNWNDSYQKTVCNLLKTWVLSKDDVDDVDFIKKLFYKSIEKAKTCEYTWNIIPILINTWIINFNEIHDIIILFIDDYLKKIEDEMKKKVIQHIDQK